MSGWSYTLEELAQRIGTAAPRAEGRFSSVSTDTRTIRRGDVFFALSGEHFDGNRFVPDAFAKGAAAAVTKSPVGQAPCLIVEDPLKALQRFASAHRAQYRIPVIAITGSVGKTTSKDFAAAVLSTKFRVTKTEGNLNNDIGLPLSLLRLDSETQASVIEMGANHAGEIARLCAMARPTESAITTIGEAHLEGFGSVERVAEAKAEIAAELGPSDTFYVNADDARCRKIGDNCLARKVYFGREGDVSIRTCRFNDTGEMVLVLEPIGTLHLPLPARAHAMNVALAVAIGLQHGVTEFQGALAEAARTARRFKVLQIGPITVLDDSYNANPTSMRAALEALSERNVEGVRMAALGDMLELGGDAERLHREIGRKAAECGVQRLFARGTFARTMADGAVAGGCSAVEVLESHEAIAEAIAAVGEAGDCLLVKGSRGMRMERVIECLRGRYGSSLGAGTANGSH